MGFLGYISVPCLPAQSGNAGGLPWAGIRVVIGTIRSVVTSGLDTVVSPSNSGRKANVIYG